MVTAESRQATLLPAELLGVLGGCVAGPVGLLSPLAADGRPAPGGEGRDRLRELGLLDGSGGLAAPWRRAVGVLAGARAAVRVELTGGAGTLAYHQWFDPAGGAPVSLLPAGGGLRLEDPAAAAEIEALAGVTLGASTLRSVEFEAELDVAAGFVLAALIDERRRGLLAGLVGAGEPDPPGFDLDGAAAAVTDAHDGPQWLTGVLTGANGLNPPAPADTAALLDRLATAGLLTAHEQRFVLAEPVERLCHRLLVVETVLTVAAGRQRGDGGLDQVGFSCLQSGAHDLLLVEHVGARLRLESVSPATVLDYLRLLLTDPDALADPAENAPAAAPAPTQPAPPAPAPPAEPVWAPTHTVPAGGLAAYQLPDPAAAPVAQLDAGLPVRLDTVDTGWGHLTCSNGWTCWVDAAQLTPDPTAST